MLSRILKSLPLQRRLFKSQVKKGLVFFFFPFLLFFSLSIIVRGKSPQVHRIRENGTSESVSCHMKIINEFERSIQGLNELKVK